MINLSHQNFHFSEFLTKIDVLYPLSFWLMFGLDYWRMVNKNSSLYIFLRTPVLVMGVWTRGSTACGGGLLTHNKHDCNFVMPGEVKRYCLLRRTGQLQDAARLDNAALGNRKNFVSTSWLKNLRRGLKCCTLGLSVESTVTVISLLRKPVFILPGSMRSLDQAYDCASPGWVSSRYLFCAISASFSLRRTGLLHKLAHDLSLLFIRQLTWQVSKRSTRCKSQVAIVLNCLTCIRSNIQDSEPWWLVVTAIRDNNDF